MRPFSLVLALFTIFFRYHREKLLAKYGPTYKEIFWNLLFAGRFGNLLEFDYYKRTHDIRVAPTTRIFLEGWIVIQERGRPVAPEELEQECPFDAKARKTAFAEIEESKQFCRLKNGKIVLCDYGSYAAINALKKTPFRKSE